jgi:heme/copper-type cytochrome/quinol oxidase subunit 2
MGPGMMGPGMVGPGMMGFGSSGPASSPIPGASEVRVEALNFGFSPSEVHLPKNADVNLTFSVPAANGVAHDFTVPALGIHVVANPGETRTVGLRGLPAGRYDAFCSVPGHAEAGMRATVVVN